MTSKQQLECFPTPIERHKIWLKEVASHYGVSEEDITAKRKGLNLPEVAVARQTFYWLCWRDRINLNRLSVHFGKDRSTISSTMSRGTHNRQRNIENMIYEKVTAQEKREAEEEKS